MFCDICNQFQGRWPIDSRTESHKHRGDGVRSLKTPRFTWDELLSSSTRCYVCNSLVKGCRGVFSMHGIGEIDIEYGSLLFYYPSTIEDVEGADSDKHLTFHLSKEKRFEIELFVTDDDGEPFPEAWDYIATLQRTSPRTDSAEALVTINNWVAECTEDHVDNLCKTLENPELPERVVDVGSCASEVKLFEPNGAKGEYICLSHCWGREQIITTIISNFSQHISSIPWLSLSKTFQDAITLTRTLGFKYIWIDSLCIIQDSASDWAIESSKMASIYSKAHLTLAGTKSPNGAGGLFSRTPDFRVTDQTPDGEAYSLYFRERIDHHLDLNLATETSIATETYYPLLTRAWVYQERMLSPRVLHFGRYEIFFECRSSVRCECGGIAFHGAGEELPAAIMKIEYANGLADLDSASRTKKRLREQHVDKIRYHAARLWRSLVCTYTALNLTKSCDRLPAFGGLARQMYTSRSSRYIAGLWEDSLQDDLLWSANTHSGYLSARPEPRNAPTWSWASVEVRAGVDYAHGIVYTCLDEDGDGWEDKPFCEYFARIEGCVVSRSDGTVDEFGAVGEGELVITGLGVDGVLRREAVTKAGQERIEHFVQVGDERVRMLSDYLLDEEGGNQVLPGSTVYCLRMRMMRQGTKDYLVSLVLRGASSKPGCYERIGSIKVTDAIGPIDPHGGMYIEAKSRTVVII
ncbi:heterokaryon incompatibility protein-domain-containing protein [Paraphoma chrysanthemicola]|uniref:Heterokaryon incompatibility protein-domain-containing protein n=1 Tax=Paraphoma chrysanthemicola TaxID=798071 RepID=A0A8K0R9J5_9PLEO|nr:heterokaryon incompatibility protein-domain-containing protein [Paraphoma chrysanthemicola]